MEETEMSVETKNLIYIHISVLFMGLSGLFGKLVSLPAPLIALGRVVFSSLFLFLLNRIRKNSLRLEFRKEYATAAVAGVLLALHWTAFMQSAQVATVAVATLTFATYPLVAAFAEPVLYKEKLQISSVICAIIMIVGVLIIMPAMSLDSHITQGVIWGMISSIAFGTLSLANRGLSDKYVSSVVSFYEQGIAALVLLPVLFIMRPAVGGRDLLGLLFLGIFCTALAHTLFIAALRHVKVQTAGIISGMESVYGILFAFLILGEIPSLREIAGGTIILGVVFYSTLHTEKQK